MTYLTPEANRLLAAQHGAVGVTQLQAAGLTPDQIRVLVRNDVLSPIIVGAYRLSAVPESESVRCVAVCLTRSNAVIAGPTAGRLWGFRAMPRDRRVHVLLPPMSRAPAAKWVAIHRSAAVHSTDIVRRSDGITLTSRARTALDLARFISGEELLSVIEQAMHDGQIPEAEMRAVAVDWLTTRRPWVARYLRSLDRRLPGASAESHPEVRVGNALRSHGIRGLVRQHPVTLSSGRRVRFDLAVPEEWFAIEVDVHPTHQSTAGAADDESRDLEAEADGWWIERITVTQYRSAFDASIERTVHHLRQRRLTTARSGNR